jgi:hypothetical protein
MTTMFPPRKLFIALTLLASASVVNGTYPTTGTPCINQVTGFKLVDASTTPAGIRPFPQDGVIDLTTFPNCELNIIAETSSLPPAGSGRTLTSSTASSCDPIRCVKLWLGNDVRRERVPPYTLYGDQPPNYFDEAPDLGKQTLKACTYTDSDCTKGEAGCVTKDVEVKGGGSISSLVLYDAATVYGSGAGTTIDGSPICYPPSGMVNIEAVTDKCVRKVDFELTGGGKNDDRTENQFPFFLYGNSGTTLFGEDGFQIGPSYTVSAIPNNDSAKKVEKNFTFKDCSSGGSG